MSEILHHLAHLVFAVGALSTLWVLVGYPVALRIVCALRRPREVVREWSPRTVTVLLPVLNGESFIRAKLESILALDYPRELIQILVLENGSTDGTGPIIDEFADRGIVHAPVKTPGKGAALDEGLARATGEILFFTDVRQALERDALRLLVENFADPTVGVVSGELVIRDGETLHEAHIGLYWRFEKSIRRRLSNLDSVIGATGCIYAMRRSLAVPVPATVLVDDMFLPMAAFFEGYRVLFDGRAKAYDYPTSLRSEFRRKVRTLAGNWQLLRYYPQLLLPSNRMWVHFVSHKLGRCLLPVSLGAAVVTTPFLPQPLLTLVATGEIFFCALAVLDGWLPEGSLAKRPTSLARTFASFMAAAFCAYSVLLPGGRRFWKETTVREPRADPQHPTRKA